jgi:hypothetical protein
MGVHRNSKEFTRELKQGLPHELTREQQEELLGVLKERFEKNMIRHEKTADGDAGNGTSAGGNKRKQARGYSP